MWVRLYVFVLCVHALLRSCVVCALAPPRRRARAGTYNLLFTRFAHCHMRRDVAITQADHFTRRLSPWFSPRTCRVLRRSSLRYRAVLIRTRYGRRRYLPPLFAFGHCPIVDYLPTYLTQLPTPTHRHATLPGSWWDSHGTLYTFPYHSSPLWGSVHSVHTLPSSNTLVAFFPGLHWTCWTAPLGPGCATRFTRF